jgi:Fur family peroxide stress response transcriptional regulator
MNTNNLEEIDRIMAPSEAEIIAGMKRAGCRVTSQRRAIVACLAGRPDHPSARQIYRDLRPTTSRLCLATVYNTLSTLVDLGVVREIEFDAADNRYDTNPSPHVNLVCVRCGSITDWGDVVSVTPSEIRNDVGFEMEELRVECRGVCARCRNQGAD